MNIDTLNLETLMDTAKDAGFIVDAVYPDVIISLCNRAVTTTEVAFALGIEPDQCYRDGSRVLIYMGED